MDSSLRYTAGQDTPMPDTYFDFSETNGILVLQKCVPKQKKWRNHVSKLYGNT
jgi:hypothetical protein